MGGDGGPWHGLHQLAGRAGQGRAGGRPLHSPFGRQQLSSSAAAASRLPFARMPSQASETMPPPTLACLRIQALERQQREYDLHAPAAAVHKVACTAQHSEQGAWHCRHWCDGRSWLQAGCWQVRHTHAGGKASTLLQARRRSLLAGACTGARSSVAKQRRPRTVEEVGVGVGGQAVQIENAQQVIEPEGKRGGGRVLNRQRDAWLSKAAFVAAVVQSSIAAAAAAAAAVNQDRPAPLTGRACRRRR